jgi:Chaperone of endosialidase
VGSQALYNNTTGDGNTASGFQALYSNTTGVLNGAFGDDALFSNTVGIRNVGLGISALNSLTSGDSNTAVGNSSLQNSETVNFNTAVGRRALYRCQGDQNIGLGFFAGSNLNDVSANNIYIGNVGPVPIGAESNIIRIGTQTASTATIGNPPIESHILPAHTATFIAGISGTGVSGSAVRINSSCQLGVAPSSARFKQEIQSMDNASDALLALRPVTFRYKPDIDAESVRQFGLVAEEVEKVNPDLVVHDDNGKPFTVRYEAVERDAAE